MTNSFTPESLTFKKVFSNSIYRIPEYQRPYSWKDTQIEQLWEDLYSAFQDKREYFLGSLIVIEPENGFEDVIDWQQRITTLLILFHVLYELYPNINSTKNTEDNPQIITNKKIKSCIFDDEENSRLRLFTHEFDWQNLKKVMKSDISIFDITKPNKKDTESADPKYRFQNTAYIFREKLALISDEIDDFVNFIFNDVRIIKITCSNTAFAINIFTTLNDRGLSLSPSYLIKWELLKKVDTKESRKEITQQWKKLEWVVERISLSMDDAFVIYLYSQIGENFRKSLVEEFRIFFDKSQKSSSDFMNQFDTFIENLCMFLWEENTIMYSFLNLDWGNFRNAIMGTFLTQEPWFYRSKKYEFLEIIRNFYYIYWVAGKTISSIKQTSFNIIKTLNKGWTLEEIIEIIEKKKRDDGIEKKYIDAISGNIYGEYWAKPLLVVLEYKLRDETASRIWIDKKLQLEHIFPQTRTDEWSHIPFDFGEKYLNTFGNLALLSWRKNASAQNDSFEKKKEVYKKDWVAPYQTTQDILQFSKWDESTITQRQEKYIAMLKNIFHIQNDI